MREELQHTFVRTSFSVAGSNHIDIPLPPLVCELPQNCPLNTADKGLSIAHANLDVETDAAAEGIKFFVIVNAMEVCHAQISNSFVHSCTNNSFVHQ